jgi:transposase-like protein
MEAQDFRALVDQLGDLTEVQRAALAAALAGQNSANEAIAMIQTRFALSPTCGHCKSIHFWSWGMASGLKRYMCRDCNRTFNALTGTPLAQLHRRDAWLDYARAMVDRRAVGGAQGAYSRCHSISVSAGLSATACVHARRTRWPCRS